MVLIREIFFYIYRRTVEVYIPSLPKTMQKELHNLNMKVIPKD